MRDTSLVLCGCLRALGSQAVTPHCNPCCTARVGVASVLSFCPPSNVPPGTHLSPLYAPPPPQRLVPATSPCPLSPHFPLDHHLPMDPLATLSVQATLQTFICQL